MKDNHPDTEPLQFRQGQSNEDDAGALAEFTDYFVHNYPGPDTIISNPRWHAPKIFKAAQRALIAQRADQPDYSQIIATEAVKHAVAFYLAGGDDWRERAIEDVRNLIRYTYDKKLRELNI